MNRVYILIILAIALGFRSFFLTSYPSGFNADEASFGYDAYSLMVSGRDQWGSTLPIVLKSFGDYKSPLYSYLSILPVSLLGLNVIAVRVMGILMGTLSVYVFYLLVKKLTKLEWVSLTASLFLAVNPWSVMLGRGAFESNLLTLLIPLFIYLFLIKKYSASVIIFGLSLFAYHSAKFISPVVMLGLVLLHRNEIKKLKGLKIYLPLMLLVVSITAFIVSFLAGGGSRIAERSITQGALLQGFDERVASIKKGANPVIAKIFHNKYQVIAKRFVNNYLQYFSPKFLIIKGAGEGSYGMIPGIGVLHLFEIVAIFGIWPLLRFKKIYKNLVLVLFIWLAITPLPAALATGVGYAGNRATGMMPVLQIIAALGLLGWSELLNRKNIKTQQFILAGFIILAAINITGFSKAYFKTPDNKILRQSGYGFLDMATIAGKLSESRNIIISRNLSEPHIFLAFANKLNPNIVQESSKNWDLKLHKVNWVDQLPSYSLGRFTVKSIDWEKDVLGGSIIIVGADEKMPTFIPIKTISYPDGSPNIFIIDTNQKVYASI